MTEVPPKRPSRPRRAAASPVVTAADLPAAATPTPAEAAPAVTDVAAEAPPAADVPVAGAAAADPPAVAVAEPAPAAATAPARAPTTLAIDIGGSGLKAAVLDADGNMIGERVRVATKYPCPPEQMVAALQALVLPLPSWDRISIGFPGMVRGGKVLSAPHFVTVAGPGTKVSPKLEKAWARFDLAGEVEARLGKPTKLANDADVQGAAVVTGHGLELVITLGTGLGTAVFSDGKLAPHLELAHHPFRKGQSYNEQIGDEARTRIGAKKWNRRVLEAVATLDALVMFDHLYVGGGNASKVTADLGPRATIVSNTAGVLGGIMLWERTH